MTDAKRRLLDHLKRRGPSTASSMAEVFGLTDAAVRQHLSSLASNGLVSQSSAAAMGRGRPATVWSLTDLAADLFPDRHSDLTLELISSIRTALGEEGLERVVQVRTNSQRVVYGQLVSAASSWQDRVQALATRRSDEGYMAEVVVHDDYLLLIENHCPICDAATSCTNLCQAELDLFQATLGAEVEVSRIEHLLSGDRRCVYRIGPVTDGR